MSNDPNKPKRRSWWSGTKRDLEGASAAKERARSHADQLEALAEKIEAEKPEVDACEDVEWDDIPTDVTEEQLQKIRQDPLMLLLFAKLHKERRRRANQVTEAMGEKPPADEIKSIKWKVNIIWWLLIAVSTAAGGSIFTVAKFLRSSGGDAREHELAHKRLDEHDVDHEARIRALEGLARENAARISDHLTNHPGRRSDAAWPLQPSPVPTPANPSAPK